MDSAVVTAPSERTLEGPRLKTWQWVVIMIVASVVLSWLTNEFVMTKETYRALFSERLETSRIDEMFDMTAQFRNLGYLFTPPLVVLRILLPALLLQAVMLLFLVEIRLADVFRVCTIAFTAPLYGTLVRTIGLMLGDNSTITPAAVSHIPGSLANFLDAGAFATPLYQLLSLINIYEALWCGIVIVLLGGLTKLKRAHIGAMVFTSWVVMTLFRWSIVVIATRLQA